jgi:hypothetical protein
MNKLLPILALNILLLGFISVGRTYSVERSLFINEFIASNSNSARDPQGQYDDWIELHNYGTDDIDVGGMYLTDDLTVPTKWRIPAQIDIHAGGYLLIWADNDTTDTGLHANFKLNAGGEEIGLFDSDGSTLIDSVTFGEQISNVSFGRYPDASDNWRSLDEPSPTAENTIVYEGFVGDVQFSIERGFYDEPFSLTLATETEDAEIYYTTDSSEPYEIIGRNLRGKLYASPISIDRTTCLRAIAIRPNWKPSNITTNTYIFLDDVIRQPANPAGFPRSWGNRTADYAMDQRVVNNAAYRNEIKDDLKSTPSVCIVIDNADFFGSGGIYANATSTGDQWERAASVEWIDPGTGDTFAVNAGLRIHGGPYSRSGSSKNALRIIFRGEYGLSRLQYPLFPDTEVETFNTLALRAIWNYSWTGHSGMSGSRHADYLRDAFARDTVRDMGNITPYGRPVQVYINGLYWGLYIMTERPDEHFVAEHLGGDREGYDVLEAPSGMGASTTMEIISGGVQARRAWDMLFDLANGDLASLQAYEEIQKHIDLTNMIDYMLMIYYTGSRDAPVFLGDSRTPRNFYVTRQREPASPFMIVPWDTEWALEEPTINRVNVVGIYNPHYLINRLLKNSDFRILMADRIYRYFYNEGALTTEKSTQRYMARANEIYGAIVGESARWGDSKRPNQPYTRDVEWADEVNRLVNQYFSVRTNIVMNQIRQAGLYPSVSAPGFYVGGQSHRGGHITSVDMISMTGGSGSIWYTTDGTDPRRAGIRTEPTDQLTLVAENAPKRSLVPTGPISDNWKDSRWFNDSSWLSSTAGPGGVGYERSAGYEGLISIVLNRMYGINTSCYVRLVFNVATNIDDLQSLILKMRYDDGFIAYLNGTEVARRNFSGTPVWNSYASSQNSDSAAVNFENINITDFLKDLKQGDNILAIQGLNVSTTSSDLLISVELVAGLGSSSDYGDNITSSGALEYIEPISLSHSAHVKARALRGNTWSALNEATFAVDPVAENLRITEIMYNPNSLDNSSEPNEEYIELVNIGAETINLNLVKFTNGIDFVFPSLELTPGEYVVVVQDVSAFEARYGQDVNIAGQYSGRLNNAGERIRLADAVGQTILDFSYRDGWCSVTDGDGFSMTVIDPFNTQQDDWDGKDSWRASAYIGGSPGEDDDGIIPNLGTVVINELLANSPGNSSDWIELHNTTDAAVNIGGWFLSDSGSNLKKYEIAAGTSIAPNRYIVFYEDQHFNNPTDPGSRNQFALSENGERVYLSAAQNDVLTGYREVEDFGASMTDVSFGRYYKSSTDNYNFVAMSESTPGSANAYPKVGPIVINEIMYNPSWPNGGSYINEQYEYIELHNIGSVPVNLQGWQFTEGINFTFSVDIPVTVPAGGYLLVVKHPEAFMWRYPSAPVDNIFGPYGGNLSNAGERLELSMPGDIRIDRIRYSDGSHPENCPGGVDLWPVEADGAGQSLIMSVPSDYGNDPNNWIASPASPGTVNP